MKIEIDKKYQQCSRCVMDTTATDISFNENGICNFLTEFLSRSSDIIFEKFSNKEYKLNQLVQKVKDSGKGKDYDCIVGVSGGVDSSWTLVEVKRLGLRPLAVHMDNGWNSELAQNNISNLVRSLDVDLYTHVINWEEYRDLMQAFFDADVIDVELLYDNAMLAVNYQMAKKYGLKFILAGTNQATEGMRMPDGWNWYKMDRKNILAIGKRNNIRRFKSFPSLGTLKYAKYRFVEGVEWVSFLDFLSFNKITALDNLESNFGYRRYPFKHYESVFTRFYQGYILPHKFSVDKRKLHLSTLIVSGQLTREDAVKALDGLPYPSENEMEVDLKYFLKKMKWDRRDLDSYIRRPGKSHLSFSSEKLVMEYLFKIKNILNKIFK